MYRGTKIASILSHTFEGFFFPSVFSLFYFKICSKIVAERQSLKHAIFVQVVRSMVVRSNVQEIDDMKHNSMKEMNGVSVCSHGANKLLGLLDENVALQCDVMRYLESEHVYPRTCSVSNVQQLVMHSAFSLHELKISSK